MSAFFDLVEPCIENAVSKIESLRKADTLVFPVFTDLHTMDAQHEFSEKLIYTVEKLCRSTHVDGIINLGDTFAMLGRMIQIPNDELAGRFEELFTKIHKASSCPLINVNGNHDAIGTDFFKPDFWNAVVKGKYGNDKAVYSSDGSYYYIDFDKAPVRLVTVSLPHESDLEEENPTPIWSFGEKQLDWLEKTALDTNRPVVILSHVPFYANVYHGNPETMLEVWNGKRRAMSYVSALCGWIDDIDRATQILEVFSKKGKLVAIFSGHTHRDSFWEPYEVNGKYTNPAPCKQVVTGSTFIDTKIIKMDIIVYTPSEDKLDIIRLGDGEDRRV